MADNADHNLLVGILAVQLDFIDRDQLISAMQHWIAHKSQPLDEILMEQGFLGSDTRQLLIALVNTHVRLHERDPRRSLATLSSIGSLREELNSLADPDLDATLPVVGAQRRVPDDPGTSVGISTSSGSRFRILRPHARGGLGEVFIAEDQELHREVAVKEIQQRFADDQDRRTRFTIEAEITGGLEHPGIVPVYGLGHYGDGRPFYAMRFVRGQSLRESIRQFHSRQSSYAGNSVEFRKLLGRFIDVCDAIEYAHSRGVLHRDLKPGNIMLGKYGETLVVDWGLAKAVGREHERGESEEPTLQPSGDTSSAPTQLGSAVGTPAYMSPEQAAGRIDQLDVTSDVYNLGATLYCLLCGKPPFSSQDLARGLGKVERGEFPPPRSVHSAIPRPLEAICLKAMALRREDRYPSPRELSTDLEHWLADEPVHAYREGLVSRMGRWGRRHRNWVVSGATGLVFVAVVSLIAAAMIEEKRVIAVRLSQEKEQLRQKEELARKEAEELARENRRRFDQVRELANTFIFDVHDRIAPLQGSTPARRFLVATGLQYLDKLAAEGVDEQPLLIDLADGYRKIGDVQGNAQNANLGDTQGALDSYRKAIEFCRQGLRRDPDDTVLANRLATLMDREGTILQQLGRTDEAMRKFEESLSLLDSLAKGADQDAQIALSRWSAINRIGDLHSREGRPTTALRYHRRALTIMEQLVKQKSDSDLLRRFLAINHLLVGKDQRQLQQFELALESYRQNETIVSSLLEENPNSALCRRDTAYVHWVMAQVLHLLARTDEALTQNEIALQGFKMLAESAEDVRAQRDWANALQTQGMLLRAVDRTEEALAAYQQGLDLAVKLCEHDPQNDYAQRDVAIFHNKLGELFEEDLGQLEKAVQHYQQALERHLARSEQTANPMYQRSIAIGYQNVGIVREKQRRYREALDAYVKSLEIREGLWKAQPENPTAADDFVYSCRITAWLLATCPQDDCYDGDRALSIATQALEAVDEVDRHLCKTLAASYAAASEFAEAEAWQRKAIAMTAEAGQDTGELEQDLQKIQQKNALREAP